MVSIFTNSKFTDMPACGELKEDSTVANHRRAELKYKFMLSGKL